MTVTLAQLSHIKAIAQEIVELDAANDDQLTETRLERRYAALGRYLVEQKIMRQMLDAVPEEGTFHVVYPFTRSTIERVLAGTMLGDDEIWENFKVLPPALMEHIADGVKDLIDDDDFDAVACDYVHHDGTIIEEQRSDWDFSQ
jgi:hypothetical protein